MKNVLRIVMLCTPIVFIATTWYGANDELPVLKEVFKNHFLIGGALNDNVVSGNEPEAAFIVERQYNTITAENVMKWALIHPKPNKYSFDAADRFIEFGRKNKMAIIGHTLIWNSQIPEWAFRDNSNKLLSRDLMLARMKDHIFTVVGRYKGKVHGWDVVNEALNDEGELQKTKWSETIGEDYICKAFEYAHEADPNTELYYNDYSLDKPAKRDAVVRLVRTLQSKGLRIDAVGIQGHWGMDYPIKGDLDAFIDSIAACKVKVMVTELDIDVLPNVFNYKGADINTRADLKKEFNPYPDSLPDSVQQKLAYRYADLFSQLIAHQGIVSRITFWGVSDKTSWLNDWPIRGRSSYPLLFDRMYQPKPAFFAIIKTAESKK